jgi:hypothetical protein
MNRLPFGITALLAMTSSFLAAAHTSADCALNMQDAIVVEQEIRGIRPELLDWWWDNINSSERYWLWNATGHRAFQWTTPPSNPRDLDYSVGATQQVTERVAGHDIDASITYLDPALARDCVNRDHWILARTAFNGIASEPGWLLHEYAANAAGTGIVLRTSYAIPAAVEAAYPGYKTAYAGHIKKEMQKLHSFLPGLFRKEFVEGELLTRGSYRIFRSGALKKTVVVDQEIKGITTDMIDWWWNNINTTARYKQWNPVAHISFKWLNPPANPNQLTYSVGAVQQVYEYIGPYKSPLIITWLDPSEVSDKVTYDHWLYAETDLKGLSGILPQRLIHEYTTNATGDGVLLRSTFTIPSFFDLIMPGFSVELAKHCQTEMQFWQYFLPELFNKEYLQEQ